MNLARSDSNRSKQRIKAHARTDVKEYVSSSHFVRYKSLQSKFVTAEPATVDVGADNPFFPAQRALQNWHDEIIGNRAKGKRTIFPASVFGRSAEKLIILADPRAANTHGWVLSLTVESAGAGRLSATSNEKK